MKKKVIIIISTLVIICLGVLAYLKFIKKDEPKKNEKNNSEIIETNKNEEENEDNEMVEVTDKFGKIDSYVFEVEKLEEDIYDEYKNTDFSLKKIIKGEDITGELDDVTVKIENKKIVFNENGKKIEIKDISNPISLRLQFDVSNEWGYPLFVLNNTKELYLVIIDEKGINSIKKVDENVDSFDLIDDHGILSYQESQDLTLITKKGDDIILTKFYGNFEIYDKTYDVIYLKDCSYAYLGDSVLISTPNDKIYSKEIVKYNGKSLLIKGIISYRDESDYGKYLITNDGEIFIVTSSYKFYKKNIKFKNIEINNDKATIYYLDSKETIMLDDECQSYYDGKIYNIED